MSKMTELELKALLEAEKAAALSAPQASRLSSDREQAQRYYLGDMSRDMPSLEGRSSAVSTDVADTIEGLMPTLMDIFCGGDDVVRFDPVGPEDVKAAEQETDFVNHVFMQKNPGFLILYSFIKDALLSKTGIVKVWSEKEESETKQTYLDQPEDMAALIVANPELDVVAHTEHDGLHDITVAQRTTAKCHKVAAVPPEEFGISRNARSIRDAGYVFHEVERTESDLIAEGYDAEQIRNLPSYAAIANGERWARDSVEEGELQRGEEGMNRANRLIKVTEHYVRMDYDGSGRAKLYRVTTGGEGGDILTKQGESQVIEINRIPMAAMTPIIITHRFFGRSVADLVIDIQRIKTALLRGMLDSSYLSVNPRVEIAESHATETTLDDILTMRPGMPIRTKQPGGLNWQQVPFVGADMLPIIQFMDTTREWRTGVSRQGQGLDPNALQNQVATIANQMFNAAQAKVKLIARIFAETGIRELFTLLHAEIRENGDAAQTIRLRNQWVTVDPTDWRERNDLTINVGLGHGSKAEQLAHLQMIIGAQKDAIAAGMVSPKNLYESAKQLVRLAGYKDPDRYFTAPGSAPDSNNPVNAAIQSPSDPKVQEIQLKAQLEQKAAENKAQIEQIQAQADIATQDRKTQAEMALMERKFALESQIALIEAQIKREEHQFNMQAKQQSHDAEMARASEKHRLAMAQMNGPVNRSGENTMDNQSNEQAHQNRREQ
jgi:hypothetical protein